MISAIYMCTCYTTIYTHVCSGSNLWYCYFLVPYVKFDHALMFDTQDCLLKSMIIVNTCLLQEVPRSLENNTKLNSAI